MITSWSPDLWASRLPSKHGDRVPHIVRERFPGGKTAEGAQTAEGWGGVWHYDDMRMPFMMLMAASGFAEQTVDVTTYDAGLLGSWKQRERLHDMRANHVDASLCFPNTLPRFCGQTFAERADKELALLCVRAYNDRMIDQWCAARAMAV